ncbi:hypothetical protein [Phytohabitans houttuyneae]|uniref:Helix-turn-helix domain-containing protein n=1 Tax=Phytohabitans houttuyneae TaxID=1076126 RepID=A0A6V8KFQ7_9ACTN|nr:hypothetical protein [Phytohabitans houttuyneae]GFJ79565.1 hypothetical protein Phou_037450 [Phytohabitans houttuyneae]
MTGEKLYTIAEVAVLTGYSRHSIEQDCEDGRVEFTRRGGRERVHKRMTAAQVEALRRYRTEAARPEPRQLTDIEAVVAATQAAQRRPRTRTRRRAA